MKFKIILTALAAATVTLGIYAYGKRDEYRVQLPNPPEPKKRTLLAQTWTDEQREQFHFEPQGTRLLPIRWFMALEQPCFSPFGCGLFSDPAYLRRFGFIPAPKSSRNQNGLPIGFAVDREFVDPVNGHAEPVVGLTCAACHTGELVVGDTAFQIEGGPAMVDLAAFQKAVGLAVGFTAKFPGFLGRWSRFEKRVLGDSASDKEKQELRRAFDAFLADALHELTATRKQHIYDIPAGFMRTDALTRIGNQVFADDMKNDANYARADAPVRFPQIWDAPWFTWVQYNSSIADPLVRNIGESLGVRAVANLRGEKAKEYANSVNVPGVWKLEEWLSGPAPFSGLTSPKWPGEFPKLDQGKVALGESLYKTHCQKCHLPPIKELIADLELVKTDRNHKPKHWVQVPVSGKWLLIVKDVPIHVIGTDEHQATDYKNRTADSGDLGKGRVSAAVGLDLVTTSIAQRFFRLNNFTPEQQIAWSGGRDPNALRVRDDLVYKARPLNGIWAVAPYLHNGSVLTLDALLSPDDNARQPRFYMGSKQFDPVKVGYSGEKIAGASEFNIEEPGNKNTGHRFRNGPLGNGTIGPALTASEREQLIEYLKSI